MARSKEKDSGPVSPDDFAERLYAEITKDLGQGVMVSGTEVLDQPKQVIPASPAVDIILSGGIPEGSWVSLTGAPKSGKAQPLRSTVFTVNGPKTMGEVVVGDVLIDPRGGTSVVQGLFPQGQKDIYRVTFLDGDAVECTLDHLWLVRARFQRADKILSLREIAGDLHESDGRPKWSVELPSPCEFAEQSCLLDPYLLGLLIGDGGLTHGTPVITTADQEILDSVIRLGEGMFVIRKNGKYGYRLKSPRRGIPNELTRRLRVLCLMGKGAHTKSIPDSYLYNSIGVRLALLQGLMDTDGTVAKQGGCSFSTVSGQLAAQVKWLVESLGGLCSISLKYTHDGFSNKQHPSLLCQIRMNDTNSLFRLERKKARCQPRQKKQLRRRIQKVEFIGVQEARCISVSSPSGLYLTDRFAVTHNTSLALSFAANCQKEEFGGRVIYFLDVEGRLKPMNLRGTRGLRTDSASFRVLRSTKEKILSSQDYLTAALKILHTHPKCVLIIDSISALCDEREMDGGLGTETRGGGAKILSQFLSLAANVVPVRNSIVVGVTHLISNTSGFGASLVEKAARRWQYQADIRLRVDKVDRWATGDDKEGKGSQIGQKVTWRAETSALGKPGMSCTSYLRYGVGVDAVYECIQLGISTGLVLQKGSWFVLSFLERHLDLVPEANGVWEEKLARAQGGEKLYQLLLDHPVWLTTLVQEVKSAGGAV